jgi:septum formation protein
LNPKESGMVATMSIAMDAPDQTLPEQASRQNPPVTGLPRVHLASRSARRRELLARHGVEFEAAHPGVDDGLLIKGGVTPAGWVASLAYFKAAAAMHRLGEWGYAPGELVILGADTIVVKNGELIGQPLSAADAARSIRTLENGEHSVFTGVAFIDAGTGRRDMFVDRARVRVGQIGERRINEYISTGHWQGKAGAYNLQERIDAGWPIECGGDPGTVMGLPMARLLPRLADFADSCARGAAVHSRLVR